MASEAYKTLVEMLSAGDFDEDNFLDIISAFKTRQDKITRVKASKVQAGQRVRIGRIKPKAFEGRTGTFMNWTPEGRARIIIDEYQLMFIDRHWRRYLRNDNELHAPAVTFEVIS